MKVIKKKKGREWGQVKLRPTQRKRKREAEVCLHSTHSLKLTGPWHYSLGESTSLSYFEPTHVVAESRPEQEMHQTRKIYNYRPWLFSSPQRLQHTHTQNQQDVFCPLSGWVCLALVRTSGKHLCTYSGGVTFRDEISLTTEARKDSSLQTVLTGVYNELHFWDKDTFMSSGVSHTRDRHVTADWQQRRITSEFIVCINAAFSYLKSLTAGHAVVKSFYFNTSV